MSQPSLFEENSRLRQEADDILYKRSLDAVLKIFGHPHYTGSYALGLMSWRDLDIYLETDHLSVPAFFDLGKKVAALLNPVKMSFRNELIGKTGGLPRGLYWGVYLGNERAGAWKIDIWAMEQDECRDRLNYCDRIAGRLTDASKLDILEIKTLCWKDPAYRKTYSSAEIYDAVLNHQVKGLEAFKNYLAEKRPIHW